MKRTDNSEAFKMQKQLMTLIGLWPYRTPSVSYQIYGILNNLLMCSVGISLLLSAMVTNDLAILIKSLMLFITILNSSVKFTSLYLKMNPFMDTVDILKLNHFSYYEDACDNYLKKTVDFSKLLVKFYFCSIVVTVICILTAPLLNSQEYRQTPVPFPLDLKKHNIIVYLLVYLYQCISLLSIVLTIIGFDNLPTSMMGISSAYFKILKDTISAVVNKEVIINEKSNKNMYDVYEIKEKYILKQLASCVSHHTALIQFTDSIENIFTYVFLSQLLCSAVAIGLASFAIINTTLSSMEFIFAVGFLICAIFQITLYCSYGDAVTANSSAIGDACYMSEWIYCGRPVRQSLFLIMERSKRPLVLTAGKFFDLSLISLMAVLKTAASYVTVLRQLTE